MKGEENSEKPNRGPGSRTLPVFYNPVMEFSRDLSVLVLNQYLKFKFQKGNYKIKILDGLAGSGVRGVRFANEILNCELGQFEVIINDYNPEAYKLIKKNIEINKLKNAIPKNEDINSLLVRNKFDYIDIDPFGTPIPFLDSSTRMLRNNGILAVTATDTATLFGKYPKTCLRRYDTSATRTHFSHELGVRILIGSCVRIGAKHNLGLFPLLVHATNHYYRLYLLGIRGREITNNAMNEIGYIIQIDSENRYKTVSRKEFLQNKNSNDGSVLKNENISKLKIAGPLWLGKLYKKDFVNELNIGLFKFGTSKQLSKILTQFCEEAEAPVGYYDATKLAKELKISSPPIPTIIQKLIESGSIATRTHFNPNAFKTDAKFETVCKIIKSLAK